MAEFLELTTDNVEAVFEFGDAGFEGVVGDAGRVVEIRVHGGAGEFGDGANSVGKAELAEALVFLFGEAERDHTAARFNRHGQRMGETRGGWGGGGV